MGMKNLILLALGSVTLTLFPGQAQSFAVNNDLYEPCCNYNNDCCATRWCWSDLGLEGDIMVSGGYRIDEVTANVNLFSSPTEFVGKDNLKVKDISVWQVGVKGRVSLCNFFVRGFGYWGWGEHGHYRERVLNADNELVSLTKAHVDRTRTQDTLVGAGYLFTMCDAWDNTWGLGPVAGWSYALQRVRLKNGKTNNVPDSDFEGLTYKNRWSGPWVGFDITFKRCQFRFNAGYEYHWAHWHADWELADVNVTPTAFSDSRRSKHAHGNAIYMDAFWDFACNWEVGLGFRLQEWRARHGSLKPKASLEEVGLPATQRDRVKHAKWCSAQVTVDVGYSF